MDRFGVSLPGQPAIQEITYDAYAQADRIEGHELYSTNADQSRTMVGNSLHARRLYLLEATVPPGARPPLLCQQSFRVFDEKGERIRYEINADGQKNRARAVERVLIAP